MTWGRRARVGIVGMLALSHDPPASATTNGARLLVAAYQCAAVPS